MADTPPQGGYETPPPMAPAPPMDMGGRPGPVNDTSKLLAALSYPIWIVGIVAILIDPYKDEKFVKFHAYQGIALGIAIWVVTIVLSFFLIGFLVAIVGLVYQIYLAVKAYGGEYVEVPLIYGLIKSTVGE